MKLAETETFSLENFEGPLDLLWHLINRQEVDIYQISLIQIIQQYLEKTLKSSPNVDRGAEFVALTSSLAYLKSKALLPSHEQPQDLLQAEEWDPHFEIIHQLVDYCLFKQLAKELSEREEHQSAFYLRGLDDSLEMKKNLGIDHLSLDDLASLFREVLAKTSSKKGIILEEIWKVADKILLLKDLIQEQKKIPFNLIFTAEKNREELIVTFLALLELMKIGDIRVANDPDINAICIFATL